MRRSPDRVRSLIGRRPRVVLSLLVVLAAAAPVLNPFHPQSTLGRQLPTGDALQRDLLTVFMGGDVMTGRGIDQVLPHPSEPRIHEPYVRDARSYLKLAEATSGPIRRPVEFSYIWGDALKELDRVAPDVRIINLETSVTGSDDYWKGKGINYRTHPENVPCLTVARIDVCALANNHVLDYGYSGLLQTLETLRKAGLRTAGAGRNLEESWQPALVNVPGKGRVIVFAFGTETSGIPRRWAARENRMGVAFLSDMSEAAAAAITERVKRLKQPGDVVVASIHWGSNWGYEVPQEHVRFAHRLVEGGMDIIHGHSSHHVRAIEVYRNKLILYGCGDFINDYEGISGYEEFRNDLVLMYFATLDPATGDLVGLRMTPMQIRKFRLNRASRVDAEWLRHTLTRISGHWGSRMELAEDGSLALRWK